jgi:hypothetical protein
VEINNKYVEKICNNADFVESSLRDFYNAYKNDTDVAASIWMFYYKDLVDSLLNAKREYHNVCAIMESGEDVSSAIAIFEKASMVAERKFLIYVSIFQFPVYGNDELKDSYHLLQQYRLRLAHRAFC